MNTENKKNLDGETSRNSEESSSTSLVSKAFTESETNIASSTAIASTETSTESLVKDNSINLETNLELSETDIISNAETKNQKSDIIFNNNNTDNFSDKIDQKPNIGANDNNSDNLEINNITEREIVEFQSINSTENNQIDSVAIGENINQDNNFDKTENNLQYENNLEQKEDKNIQIEADKSNFEIKSNQSSNNSNSSSSVEHIETEEMKRAAAKKSIERYFYQLRDGCGNPKCQNQYCASSGKIDKLTPNQAAARAIQLFSIEAKLCDIHPNKIPKKTENLNDAATTSGSTVHGETSCSTIGTYSSANNNMEGSSSTSSYLPRPSTQSSKIASTDYGSTSSSSNLPSARSDDLNSSKSSVSIKVPEVKYLDEDRLDEIIAECKNEKSYKNLIRTVGEVFCSAELLSKSFRKKPMTKIDEMLKKVPPIKDLKSMKKEDLRTLEGDLDKDEDSSAIDKDNDEMDDVDEEKIEIIGPNDTNVDIISLRNAMKKLFKVHTECSIYESLNNAFHTLSILLGVDLRVTENRKWIESTIDIFVIAFEVITMAHVEFLEIALPNICRAAARLPVWAEVKLARIWSEHCRDSLKNLLQALQQIISLQVIVGDFTRTHKVEDVEIIQNATKVLKVVYYANILAGTVEAVPSQNDLDSRTSDYSTSNAVSEDDDFYLYTHLQKSQSKKNLIDDEFEKELGISAMNCRVPLIPFEEFYNEPLSDTIEMDHDYLNYKNYTMDLTTRSEKKFTFMLYSFILTPATKVLGLYYDSRIRMYSERRSTLFNHHIQYYGENGAGPNPYLKLKVRREQLIDDALVELEMIAMGTPKDFKKQLVVEFVGEQGIDEGGVSKEFFQLVVEEIFNPDFGMFTYQEDTKTVWFNSTSFENEAQFTLIGIVLGLAIYNNIILAVNFPMVVYRKLMGYQGTFYDLADWNPVLFKSLRSILDYSNNDMEDVFMQTFKINYSDVFGNTLEHELKPNGGEIFVNQDNKGEFIELYSNYLLNISIERQFNAFKRGFEMVTDESPLKLLFRPEEIELLVCGSKKFDFDELEKSTEYEGGYTEKSQVIIDFWSIVHNLPLESKRKLLEFTTGSDRVPVGGLSKLKMVIARNGSDSNRLPTSHTCFNVLLLPEYDSKEKLEDRLLKAINYSKGFGML